MPLADDYEDEIPPPPPPKPKPVPARAPRLVVQPQPGPQEAFLASKADIAIYGGGGGGGKTYACLLAALRHRNNPRFHAVMFRRTGTMIRNPGGLWDKSMEIFPGLGASPARNELRWRWPSGSTLKMSHMEQEADRFAWQGAEVPLIIFDELTHFTETQFFYLMSRNRSMSGVPGRIRASCNPDPDSFVARLLEWWIDQDSGFPIPERDGKTRWFIRTGNSDVGERLLWADTPEQLKAVDPAATPKSMCFIRALLSDNKVLMERDPGYRANLRALPYVDRMRLEMGNWKVKPTAGNFFQRQWFPIVDRLPDTHRSVVRWWDRAATKPHAENPDPDWSVGIKMSMGGDRKLYIEDVRFLRERPAGVKAAVLNAARQDGNAVPIGVEQDPGSAGVADIDDITRHLTGFAVVVRKPAADKETRAGPVSSHAENENVVLLRAAWNDAFLAELENFPDGAHDDAVDALSGGFNFLCEGFVGEIKPDDFGFGVNGGSLSRGFTAAAFEARKLYQ